MSYTFSILPKSDIALFHWAGPITYRDRMENLTRITDFCRSHAVHKLIIDGRDQQSETGVVESFQFAEEVPKAFVGLRVAVVRRADDDALEFIETVASNRGSFTRPFLDFDEAREWLESLD